MEIGCDILIKIRSKSREVKWETGWPTGWARRETNRAADELTHEVRKTGGKEIEGEGGKKTWEKAKDALRKEGIRIWS